MKRIWHRGALALLLTAGLAGCGRYIPAASPELLAQKHAILAILSQKLQPADSAEIAGITKGWRENEQIAYECVTASSLDRQTIRLIKDKPFDRIVVVGNDLLGQAETAAKQTPGKKWVLLEDRLEEGRTFGAGEANVEYRTIDPAVRFNAWNAWVGQQAAAGGVILWVTDSKHPVPSAWAPSEEADHIVLTDVPGNAWVEQLAYQLHAAGATVIALFAPVSPGDLQKIRSFGLPVADINDTVTASPVWDPVFGDVLKEVQLQSWKPGSAVYSMDETVVSSK